MKGIPRRRPHQVEGKRVQGRAVTRVEQDVDPGVLLDEGQLQVGMGGVAAQLFGAPPEVSVAVVRPEEAVSGEAVCGLIGREGRRPARTG